MSQTMLTKSSLTKRKPTASYVDMYRSMSKLNWISPLQNTMHSTDTFNGIILYTVFFPFSFPNNSQIAIFLVHSCDQNQFLSVTRLLDIFSDYIKLSIRRLHFSQKALFLQHSQNSVSLKYKTPISLNPWLKPLLYIQSSPTLSSFKSSIVAVH